MSRNQYTSQGRRAFLKQLGAGGAVISMPAFLAGCGALPIADLQVEASKNPFLTSFGIDQSMLASVMSELTSQGASIADMYFQHRRSQQLRLENGVATAPALNIEQGAGLRVINNGRTGFAATEELTLPGLLSAARMAAQMTSGAAVATPSQFVAHSLPNYYPVAASWHEVGMARRRSILQHAAASAQAADAAVSKISVDWQDSDERVLIAMLDGNFVTDQRPLTRLSVQVEVQRGAETHSGFASVSARRGIDWYDAGRIDELAQLAVDRAVARFDARRPPLGEMPVVLAAGTSGIVLHEALGHALEADFSLPGSGPFAGRLGESIASPLVTLTDDATMAHERGALNVDDEGVAGQAKRLIEAGVLKSFLHDRQSAAEQGVAPTGSGRRESFRSQPLPRMSCTRIENGSETVESLLNAAGQGILADTFSTGRVDPASGDFSFKINSGWFIERGKKSYPVRDLELHGNGPALLGNVQMLANDLQMDAAGWTCGKRGQRVPVSQGMPTALVTGLKIGG